MWHFLAGDLIASSTLRNLQRNDIRWGSYMVGCRTSRWWLIIGVVNDLFSKAVWLYEYSQRKHYYASSAEKGYTIVTGLWVDDYGATWAHILKGHAEKKKGKERDTRTLKQCFRPPIPCLNSEWATLTSKRSTVRPPTSTRLLAGIVVMQESKGSCARRTG